MTGQRFPSHRRILTSKEFDAVFKGSNYRVSCAEFLILAIENRYPKSRIGMVIGKKNTSRAVDRNHIKRRIRETFRTVFTANCSVDVVIVSRSGVNRVKGAELTTLLTHLWRKLEHKALAVTHG
jgi:ribonuclease P protein component